MTGPKISLAIPETTTTTAHYATLECSASAGPHSPTSSEASEATNTDTGTGAVQTYGSEFVWTPPALDPKYWDYVAKAQKIRSGVTELKQRLALKKDRDGDAFQRLSKLLRARERKLMRYIDQHVLDFDDVIRKTSNADESKPRSKSNVVSKATTNSKTHHVELGTISPPISPDLALNRPLPPLPPGVEQPKAAKLSPRFILGPLPLTPPEKKAAASANDRGWGNTGLGSQGFIHSYKKTAKLASEYSSDCEFSAWTELGDAKERSRGRLLQWAGLFGSKNIRPVGNSAAQWVG